MGRPDADFPVLHPVEPEGVADVRKRVLPDDHRETALGVPARPVADRAESDFMLNELTQSEKHTIAVVYANHGRQAKRFIRKAWETANYAAMCYLTYDQKAGLQKMRNSLGPAWLAKVSLLAISQEIHAARIAKGKSCSTN